MEPWRRPITVVGVEQSVNGAVLDGEDISIQWHIGGPIQQQWDDAERLRLGMACPNCLEVFPAPPSLSSLHLFREVYQDKPDAYRTRALDLVRAECCPICGCHVASEAAAMFDGGELPEPAPIEPRPKKPVRLNRRRGVRRS